MEYERVLIVKPEVFVYKIPPRSSNRVYRAADWNLKEPTWTGRMRLLSINVSCVLRLEDKNSGELFANCPIDAYPGLAMESVSDSSRYFVIRVQDDNGRAAFLGLGFGDRSDSFDLNVALQDHFKWVKNQQQIEKEQSEPKQELDLGFKDGETIKINMRIAKMDGTEGSPRSSCKGKAFSGLLPPPPAGPSKIVSPAKPAEASTANSAEWNDYAFADNTDGAQDKGNNWVQF